MSLSNFCPECCGKLSTKAKRCSCGWQRLDIRNIQPVDRRCQYVVADRRCPLMGTVSASTNGHGARYCSGHLQTLDNPRLGEAILRHAEGNFRKISQQRDWRDELIDEYLKSYQLKIKEKNHGNTN